MPERACCASAHVYSCMYRSASKLGSSSPSSSLFSFVTPLCKAAVTAAQTQQVLTRRTRVTFMFCILDVIPRRACMQQELDRQVSCVSHGD